MRAGWIDCFRPGNKILYRTFLGVFEDSFLLPMRWLLIAVSGMSLQSFQQLTGANYFFYYGATIFQAVGVADSFVTQIILGTVNFVCTFGGLYVMQRVRPNSFFFFFGNCLLNFFFCGLRYSSAAVCRLLLEGYGNRCGFLCLLRRGRQRTRCIILELGNVCLFFSF